MKILVLNYRDRLHPLAGGAEVHLHRIFGRIAAQGHQVLLLCTAYQGGATQETVDGIQVQRFGSDLTYPFMLWPRIRQSLKFFPADVIVEDINKLPFYSFGVSSTPKFLIFHHLWMGSIFKEASFPIALGVWLHEQALRIFYKHYPASAVSPSTIQELKTLGFQESQLHLIYNGSESSWFEHPPIPLDQRPKRLVWMGRLRKYKGIWVAIHAMEIALQSDPSLEFIIAGSGPGQNAVENYLQQKQIHQIKYVGHVQENQKKQLLRESLATIQSSFKEGWGLTVIEAAACGTPTIAANVAGLRDSVLDQQTGFLFEAGNSLELAQKILHYSQNLNSYLALSSQCVQHAQQFSWDQAAQKTLEQLYLCTTKKISCHHP